MTTRRRMLAPKDLHDGFDGLDARIAETASAKPDRKGSTLVNDRRVIAHFEAMLAELGFANGLADLKAQCPADTMPEIPPVMAAAFMVWRLRTQRPRTADASAGALLSALGVSGWDVHRSVDARRAGFMRAIRDNAEHLSPDDLVAVTHQARPLLPVDVERVLDVLDTIATNPGATHPAWISSWRAIILLGWFLGLRSGELVLARWGWITWLEGDGRRAVEVTLPAGLKYQKKSERYLIEGTGGPMCAVDAIWAWRQTAKSLGIGCTDDDPLFVRVVRRDISIPAVARGPGKGRRAGLTVADITELNEDLDRAETVSHFCELNPDASSRAASLLDSTDALPERLAAASGYTVCWRCARCGWRTTAPVAQRVGCASCRPRSAAPPGGTVHPPGVQFYDPAARFVHDPTWRPDEPELARNAEARSNTRRCFAADWAWICERAGFEARTDLEFVGLYSMRRGTMTTMHRAGTAIARIMKHARHTSVASTSGYIGTADVPNEDVAHVLSAAKTNSPALESVAPHLLPSSSSPSGAQLTCEIAWHHRACGRAFASMISIEDELVPGCAAHYGRHSKGWTGDALMRPIAGPGGKLPCEVSHEDVACGVVTMTLRDMDGQLTAMCGEHRKRYERGERGHRLTRPVGPDAPPATCEVGDDEALCGRGLTGNVDDDGRRLGLCSLHYQRWQKGDRGDYLARPAGRHLKSNTCEVPWAGASCGRRSESFIDLDGSDVEACGAHASRARKGKVGDDLCRPIGQSRQVATAAAPSA